MVCNVESGKEIKIVYDDPWFWKVSAYRESKNKARAPRSLIRLDDSKRHNHKEMRKPIITPKEGYHKSKIMAEQFITETVNKME